MTGPTQQLARSFPTIRIGLLALLAALLVLPLSLAARAEAFVYWANFSGDAIGRANLDGSGVDQSFISGASNSRGVTVDAAHVYWTNGLAGTIGRANLDGSGVEQSFISGAAPWGVAVDAAHVYWTNPSTIGRANLDGSGVDQNFIVTGASAPRGVAVDAAHIYWTNSGLNTNTIGRANLDGSGVDQSFIEVSGAVGLAVDAEHVYWTDSSTGTIGRANLDGSGVEPRFIEANGPVGLAVDAAHVYWTTDTIGRSNLDGSGADQSFIAGAVNPSALAVNFSVGKLKKDTKKGTGRLKVEVPASAGIALAETEKLKGAQVRAAAAGEVTLPIKPRGKAKKKLTRRGKLKIEAEVTYTPDGGEAEIQTTTLKLVKRS